MGWRERKVWKRRRRRHFPAATVSQILTKTALQRTARLKKSFFQRVCLTSKTEIEDGKICCDSKPWKGKSKSRPKRRKRPWKRRWGTKRHRNRCRRRSRISGRRTRL